MRRARAAIDHRAALAAAAVALLAALTLHASGVLDGLERDSVNTRFSVRGPQPVDDTVVVTIDEQTFSDLDTTWPFSRKLHARMVDRLWRAGARLIVYDVQFTEPSPDAAADMALYRAVSRAGGVLLATGESDSEGRTNVLGGDENLADIGARAGASNLRTDPDGVVRHYGYTVGRLPTLPVLAAEQLGHPVKPADFRGGQAWLDFRGEPQ